MNIELLKTLIDLCKDSAQISDAEKHCPAKIPVPGHDFQIGHAYHVETVTKYFTGKFQGFNGHELCFTECAWIPDIGRAGDAYEKGSFSEVEPFPATATIMVGRGAVVMAFAVGFKLPTSQK